MRVGFIGAGAMGGNLANLLHDAGHDVLAGLRDPAQARADARYRVAGVENAAVHGDVVVLALHYSVAAAALPPLASRLAGRIVVDATNPLNDDWSPRLLGERNSAGEEIARLLPESRVVKAFNTIFGDVMRPDRLDREGRRITAFIAADDRAAAGTVGDLARDAGFAPLIVGPLAQARHLEAMAHLNIAIAVAEKGGTDAAFVYSQRIPPR